MKQIIKFNKIIKSIFYIFTLAVFTFSTVSCGSNPEPETSENQEEVLLEKVDDDLLLPDEEIIENDDNSSQSSLTEIPEENNDTSPDNQNVDEDYIPEKDSFNEENNSVNVSEKEKTNPEEESKNSLTGEKTDTKNESSSQTLNDEKLNNNIVSKADSTSNEAKASSEKSNADVKEKKSADTKEASETPVAGENINTSSENTEASDETDEGKTETSEEKEPEVITPSRSVTIAVNQYLDIIYPGSGWIYLGETNDESIMRYFGRKINEADTKFTLKPRNEGMTIAHFYKNDALTGTFIDDYLEIIITGLHGKEERVTAPSYADAVPPKPQDNSKNSVKSENTEIKTSGIPASNTTDTVKENIQESNSDSNKAATTSESVSKNINGKQQVPQPEENVPTVIQTTENQSQSQTLSKAKENSDSKKEISKDMNAEELIGLANSCFAENNYEDALEYLNSFFNIAVNRIDEGLFLQGQILEANSILRNIKAALDSYETLIKMYPQSEYWQKANERIIYLNRFYFNIR